MEGKSNIYLYVLKMTLVMAAILAVLSNSLDPITQQNRADAKKKAILSCIPDDGIDLSNTESVKSVYDNSVTMFAVSANGTVYNDSPESLEAINAFAVNGAKKYKTLAELNLANEEKKSEKNRVYPVYKYKKGESYTYVVAIRGNGLWDKIWGYIALESDLNTIAGVFFDHKGETPGLGAEIKDSEAFKITFKGKKVFNAQSAVAVNVVKKGVKNEDYDVNGIAGATVTCDGVTDMFKSGMAYYTAYFAKEKNS